MPVIYWFPYYFNLFNASKGSSKRKKGNYKFNSNYFTTKKLKDFNSDFSQR